MDCPEMTQCPDNKNGKWPYSLQAHHFKSNVHARCIAKAFNWIWFYLSPPLFGREDNVLINKNALTLAKDSKTVLSLILSPSSFVWQSKEITLISIIRRMLVVGFNVRGCNASRMMDKCCRQSEFMALGRDYRYTIKKMTTYKGTIV